MNPADYHHRKGARCMADVPSEVAELLNLGMLSTVNLPEWLLVNHRILAQNLLREGGFDSLLPEVLMALDSIKKPSALQSIVAIGRCVSLSEGTDLFHFLARHPCDSARSYAAIAVGVTSVDVETKLRDIRPFAADDHFGVREIAWLSVRSSVDAALIRSIGLLKEWSTDGDANVRRFASEVLRPRGVWCKHIDRLKREPELALPVLEPLRSDASKYVRDSVANHLNDASKTRPDFVESICMRWLSESPTPETKYIVRRGMRSL